MISAYVIPQPPVPSIVEIHRRNVTLAWETSYFPSPQDQTKYGVNITICNADSVLQSQTLGLLSVSSSVEDSLVSGCIVVIREKKDLVLQSQKLQDDLESRIVVTTIQNLQPSMSYKFR